tara:strand:- start:1632 stop:3398 length:1767 start_codon:yes stop_codon:yes gene_type:complete
MNNFKVGNKVILEKYGAVGPETSDWTKQDKLPLNTELEIISVNEDEYVELKGYSYGHHYSKFKLASSFLKPCYKSDGTRKTGKRIIETLVKLGAEAGTWSGDQLDYYYFITVANKVSHHSKVPEGYELKELPEKIVSSTPKIYYKGDGTRETGKKIIKALEDLGCKNDAHASGEGFAINYYNFNNVILATATVPEGYTQAFLKTDEVKGVSIKPLTKEDMVEGEAYMIKRGGNLYIVNTRKDYICVNNTFSFGHGFMVASWGIIELASQENKKWLEACIKAGKWMSKEEALQKPMFKKGEYIVLIDVLTEPVYKHNHCYKQRVDYHYFMSCLDSAGSTTNGWNFINHDVPSRWRYATSEEAAYYEKIGKPYDVTEKYTPTFFGRIEESMTGTLSDLIIPESNLEKAKRLYPLGTNFIAIVTQELNVSLGIFTIENNGNITVNIEAGGRHTVYQEGYERWAQIVQKAPKEEEWQVGGWVELLGIHGNNPKGTIAQIIYTTLTAVTLDLKYSKHMDDNASIYKERLKWLGMNRPSEVFDSNKIKEQIEYQRSIFSLPKKKSFDETAYNASSFNQELKLNIKKPINKKITI